MNILLTIVLVVAGLVALLLILALFAKKGYTLGREIMIHVSRQEVFKYVKLLKNQDHFNKWVMMDPDMKKAFNGIDGTEGFVYAWDGNKKAGQGEQEIMKIAEGERIDMEIRFIRPFAGIANSYMTTRSIANPGGDGYRNEHTKIKWVFSSTMKYPMNLMLLFVDMDKLLGKDLEASLANLKSILEKESAENQSVNSQQQSKSFLS